MGHIGIPKILGSHQSKVKTTRLYICNPSKTVPEDGEAPLGGGVTDVEAGDACGVFV